MILSPRAKGITALRQSDQAQLHHTPPRLPDGCVITIGAFDGVHLGHQALIRAARSSAAERGLPSVAWTFDPPPKVFFGRAPMLMTAAEKVLRLKRLGLDHIILSHFDAAFRARTAEEFVADLAAMNPAEIWIGDDFRFGAMQKGDVALLEQHFRVRMLDPVFCRKGDRISSTRIRMMLSAGKNEFVRDIIGWDDYYVPTEYDTAW